MSSNSVTQPVQSGLSTVTGSNNAYDALTGETQGGNGSSAENAIDYMAPGIGGLATSIYNQVTNPPTASLQNPAAAGAPPTQAMSNYLGLDDTLANEKTQAGTGDYSNYFGAGASTSATPMTASTVLGGR